MAAPKAGAAKPPPGPKPAPKAAAGAEPSSEAIAAAASLGADDAPPWAAAGPTGDAMLRLAAVHTACMALSDAAGHLRRTSMLVEAASTAALRDALTAPLDGSGAWVQALEGAEQTMQAAVTSFTRTTQAAVHLVKQTADLEAS